MKSELIIWLTWKLIGKTEPRRFRCTDSQAEVKDDSEKEKPSETAKKRKESQEARDDEPAQNTERGSLKENDFRLQERESLRKNEPKLSRCKRLLTVDEKPPSASSPDRKGLVWVRLVGFWGNPEVGFVVGKW